MLLTILCTSSAQEQLAVDLWQAVQDDDVSKVRSLLRQGEDPNHQFYWSDEWVEGPPLHTACYEGYLEIVKTLITHGARTNKGDGRNSMHDSASLCMPGRLYRDGEVYLIHYLSS